MEGVQIGVSTELLMSRVWGEGVTSSSKRSLARRAVFSQRVCPTTFEPDAAT